MNGDPRTAYCNLLPIKKYKITIKDFVGSPLQTISGLHRFFRQIWAILCELRSSHSHVDMQIVSQGIISQGIIVAFKVRAFKISFPYM